MDVWNINLSSIDDVIQLFYKTVLYGDEIWNAKHKF